MRGVIPFGQYPDRVAPRPCRVQNSSIVSSEYKGVEGRLSQLLLDGCTLVDVVSGNFRQPGRLRHRRVTDTRPCVGSFDCFPSEMVVEFLAND